MDTSDSHIWKCCPKCYSNKIGGWYEDNIGDGKCQRCEGTGKVHVFGSEFLGIVVLDGNIMDKGIDIDCRVCTGTGGCQTCGGEGRVKRKRFENSNDADEDEIENDEEDDYEDDDYEDENEGDNYRRIDDDDYTAAMQSEITFNNPKSNEIEDIKKKESEIAHARFIEELTPVLLECYTSEETEAILRNLTEDELEILKWNSGRLSIWDVKYTPWAIAKELKHQNMMLAMEIEYLSLDFFFVAMKSPVPQGIDNSNHLSYYDVLKKKIICERDYEVLKKFENLI